MNTTQDKNMGELVARVISKVKDIPNNGQFMFVSDSQDIRAVLESIGKTDQIDEIGSMFVEVLDGDYGNVYALSSMIPYNESTVFKLQ